MSDRTTVRRVSTPPPARHPYLDHPHPLAIAHRGGAGDYPENTLDAFAAAVALGYRYLETDVHLTADGVLVAFHDASLDRVTDRTGNISDLQWSQVRTAQVLGTDGSTGRISTLEEILDAFPAARFNIDPKSDAATDPLADVLTRSGATSRVCVGAFSDRRLARLRTRLGAQLCTGLGPKGVARLRAASLGLPVGRPDGDCVQVPVRAGRIRIVDRRLVDTAHRFGLEVQVWTIDEPGEMHELLNLGVDAIMTDRPGVLRDVLVQRGLWVD